MSDTDLFPFSPCDHPSDPFRDTVLLTLAQADGQAWPSLTENTNRHVADIMYGKQADAMVALFNDLFTKQHEEGAGG